MPTDADRRERRRMEELLETGYGWPERAPTRRLRVAVTVAELLLAAIAVGMLALLGSGWSP